MRIGDFFKLAAHTQTLPAMESDQEELLVGGQAVIEGVMMRSPHSCCVAVRRPHGGIAVQREILKPPSERFPVLRYPILRGLGTLGQSLWLGVRALHYSALSALEAEKKPESNGENNPQTIGNWMLTANLIFSAGFFVFFYKFLPLFLTTLLERRDPAFANPFLFNLVDGLIRLTLFLVFLGALSRWKQIQRVFEYHGAEHMTVFNFESGQSVTMENVRRFSRLHPRCGTSFLLVVMLVSLALFLFIPVANFWLRFVLRVVLLPLVAGVSYEVIRFPARHRGFLWAQLVKPGLWLQRITTQAPSDDQLEIAVHALHETMAQERAQGGEWVIP